MNSFIITSEGISLYLNGKPYSANSTHANYTKILDAARNGDFRYIPDLVNVAPAVQHWANKSVGGGVVVDSDTGTVSYKGTEIHNSLVDRILNMKSEGFSVVPMINLLENLYRNPSNRAVEELYVFLEYGKMPITEDGCFIAYKRVNEDYTSCYDSKTSNNIGEIVSMPRYLVDDRSEHTCSHGLHICSFEYLRYYSGAKVIVVKVDPADVVSVPLDYNNTKARVCKYEVIGELTFEEAGLDTHSFGTSVYGGEEYEELSDDEEDGFWDEEDVLYVYDDDFNEDDEENESNVEKHTVYAVDIGDLDTGIVRDFLLKRISKTHTPTDKDESRLLQQLLSELLTEHKHKIKESQPLTPIEGTYWYREGYNNGYHHGKHRLPKEQDAIHVDDDPGCVGTDDDTTGLSHQDIVDVNAGYDVGYVDGKKHAKRKYPR